MGLAFVPDGARGPRGGGREPRGVASLYLDESVAQCILAGLIVFLALLWSLWGAAWLRRVELRDEHDATVRALGLTWSTEGLGPSVRATGVMEGQPVEVQWHRSIFGITTARIRREGRWQRLPEGGHLSPPESDRG